MIAILAATCVACTSPFREPGGSHLIEREKLSMGSTLRLTLGTSDEAAAATAIDAVFVEFDRLEALMSIWREGSDVQRLNEAAGDHPVRVSPEVLEVLGIAHQMSEWTGGKFDITFGALSDLWRFDQDQDDRIPDPEEVRRRLPLVNYRNLELDERAGTAFLKRKGMRVHLGGIGKGYAVDRAVDILRRRGFADFMIQAGGDMYVAGRHEERPWRLGIQDPRGPANHSFATIDLSDSTFSTSGDYERFFMEDGRRFHHILDPALGEPARGSRSVTIVTKRAVFADGLSTGVFVMGPAAGMALIERLPDVEGLIVTDKNEVLVTSGIKEHLTILAPPMDAP